MKHALIFGGTRGMGLGLAAQYLARGMAVTVCGRDVDALRGSTIENHPHLRAVSLDIADANAVREVIAQTGAPDHPLDLLIITAGTYFNTRDHALDAAATMQLLRTNVSGLSHALEAGAQRMLAQGHGRIAAVSSVAGLLKDYPGASVYAATKRSVLSETYRKALAPFGVSVTAVVPGYVDTQRLRELNGGDASHKPFLMSQADAVERILKAIDEGQAVCAFPWQMRTAIALLNALPKMPKLHDFRGPKQK
jgi:short-subunit dehydrogenase